MHNSHLITAAREYASRGWSLIPLKGKEPAIAWKKRQTSPMMMAALTKCLRRQDVTGLGVICGPVSGNLACRDFDKPLAYHQWCESCPELAGTLPTVQTSRGRHVYFIRPNQRTLRFLDGELRGAGGCVALPPSLHPSGSTYRWVVPLPDGDLPMIDPEASGLIGPATERSEHTERSERSEAMGGFGGKTPRAREIKVQAHSLRAEASGSAKSILNQPGVHSRVLDAIKGTIPTGPGQRHARVFEFVRRLKAIPELTGLSPKELKPVVHKWHERARPRIATKDFLETYADFGGAWERVKWPTGTGPLDDILRKIEAEKPPACAEAYDDPEIVKLVQICHELQLRHGDQPFFLSCRTAGKLLGIDAATACRWLKVLCMEGVIQVVERGKPDGYRATRFRYVSLDAGD